MKSIFISTLFFISHGFYSQNTISINLTAPEFEKDSLILGPPMSSGNIHNIYDFKFEDSKTIQFLKDYNFALIKINSSNNFTGHILYPQPFSFSYYDPKINGGYESKPFFLEKGNYHINVEGKNNLTIILDPQSPANTEYTNLKIRLKTYDEKLKPYQENNVNDIITKHVFLKNYIKSNPDSYVAFWEIVNDFSKYGFNKIYLDYLKLFSKDLKKTFSFIEFNKILQIENSTTAGGNFPEVIFDDNSKITKSSFANYRLTLIDYWATSCKPCIEDLPKLVKLYEIYKDKGVNIISVADENQKEKITLAKNILEKHNVTWTNYFDLKKDFPKKLNAAGYPLQILVNSEGKIISRKYGELDKIDEEIKNMLSNTAGSSILAK